MTNHASIRRAALMGGLLGGLPAGAVGHGVADGWLTIAGLGQWAVAGPTVGLVTGFGLGMAAGGLVAALVALYRTPRRRPLDG